MILKFLNCENNTGAASYQLCLSSYDNNIANLT